MAHSKIPIAAKLACSLWMGVWIPTYWIHYGPVNFLWLCDMANFLIALGLWLESPLLLTSQAVAVLVIQVLWSLDFLGRLATGTHLIGGTEYMFDPTKPLFVRALSLYHLLVPAVLIWAVRRLGYHPQGWKLQTLLAWIILPASYFWGDAERNLNWIWAPFGVSQTLLPIPLFVGILMILLPLVLFLPTHTVLKRLFRAPN